MIPELDQVQGVAKGLGIREGELTPGRWWWSQAAPSRRRRRRRGGELFHRAEMPRKGVFASCFLGSSREETPSHSAALKSDRLNKFFLN